MTTPYILYGSPFSPFQRKVEAVLALKDLEYECEPVSIPGPPDWYRNINPLGSIPTLRDTSIASEGVEGTICDSSAICAYLDKKHPAPTLYPDDPFDYGRALWLEEYADTGMAREGGMGLFRPIIFHLFQGKAPDLDTARTTWNDKLPRLYDYLETQLDGRDHYIGGEISIADIAIASQIYQTDMLAGLPDAAKWPALVSHYESMKAHAAFARNRLACEKMLTKLVPEKFDLN